MASVALLIAACACHESPLGLRVATWGGPNGFSFSQYADASTFSFACTATVTAEPLRLDGAGAFHLSIPTQGPATPGPTAMLVGRVAGDTLFAGLFWTPLNDTIPNGAYGLRNQPPGPVNELCLTAAAQPRRELRPASPPARAASHASGGPHQVVRASVSPGRLE